MCRGLARRDVLRANNRFLFSGSIWSARTTTVPISPAISHNVCTFDHRPKAQGPRIMTHTQGILWDFGICTSMPNDIGYLTSWGAGLFDRLPAAPWTRYSQYYSPSGVAYWSFRILKANQIQKFAKTWALAIIFYSLDKSERHQHMIFPLLIREDHQSKETTMISKANE
jgi:hypothetical protein